MNGNRVDFIRNLLSNNDERLSQESMVEEEVTEKPMLLQQPEGKTIAFRMKTMKEYDEKIQKLEKENFDLKLRIYFLEEKFNQSEDADDVMKMNIQLKVENETLKKELFDQYQLLCSATEEIGRLERQRKSDVERVQQEAEAQKRKQMLAEMDHLQQKYERLQTEFDVIMEEKATMKDELDRRDKAESVKIDTGTLTEPEPSQTCAWSELPSMPLSTSLDPTDGFRTPAVRHAVHEMGELCRGESMRYRLAETSCMVDRISQEAGEQDSPLPRPAVAQDVDRQVAQVEELKAQVARLSNAAPSSTTLQKILLAQMEENQQLKAKLLATEALVRRRSHEFRRVLVTSVSPQRSQERSFFSSRRSRSLVTLDAVRVNVGRVSWGSAEDIAEAPRYPAGGYVQPKLRTVSSACSPIKLRRTSHGTQTARVTHRTQKTQVECLRQDAHAQTQTPASTDVSSQWDLAGRDAAIQTAIAERQSRRVQCGTPLSAGVDSGVQTERSLVLVRRRDQAVETEQAVLCHAATSPRRDAADQPHLDTEQVKAHLDELRKKSRHMQRKYEHTIEKLQRQEELNKGLESELLRWTQVKEQLDKSVQGVGDTERGLFELLLGHLEETRQLRKQLIAVIENNDALKKKLEAMMEHHQSGGAAVAPDAADEDGIPFAVARWRDLESVKNELSKCRQWLQEKTHGEVTATIGAHLEGMERCLHKFWQHADRPTKDGALFTAEIKQKLLRYKREIMRLREKIRSRDEEMSRAVEQIKVANREKEQNIDDLSKQLRKTYDVLNQAKHHHV